MHPSAHTLLTHLVYTCGDWHIAGIVNGNGSMEPAHSLRLMTRKIVLSPRKYIAFFFFIILQSAALATV